MYEYSKPMNFLDFPPHLMGKPIKWRNFYASLKKANLDHINALAYLTRTDLDKYGLKRSDWPILMTMRNWVEKNLSYPEVLALSFMRKEQVTDEAENKTFGYWLEKGQRKTALGSVFRTLWAIFRSGESLTSHYLLNGIEFLLLNQNEDGGFPPFIESVSDVAAVARILYVLVEVCKSAQESDLKQRVETAIEKAILFLENSVDWKGEYYGWYLAPETDKNYEKDFNIAATSIALYGLLYVNRGKDLLRPAIKWLLKVQNPNGGWPADNPKYDETYWTLRGFSTFLKINPGDDLCDELSESIEKAINWIIKSKKTMKKMIYWGHKTDFSGNIYALRGLLQCPTQLMPPDLFIVVQKGLTWLLNDQQKVISLNSGFYGVISHLVICIQEFKEKWNIKIYEDSSIDKMLKDVLTKIQPFFPKSIVYEVTLADKLYDAFPNIKLWKIFGFFDKYIDISGFFGIIVALGFLVGFFKKETLLTILDFSSASLLTGWLFLTLFLLINFIWLGFKLYISKRIQVIIMYLISTIIATFFIFFVLGLLTFEVGLVALILMMTFMIDIISVALSSVDFSKIFSKKTMEY